jgi:hypothetical protein
MCSEQARAHRSVAGPSRRWASCALGILALAAAGCGGGSATTGSSQPLASSQSPASSPSAQLIARADAICQRRNAALDAVVLKSAKAAAVVRFAAQSAALERAALSELSQLQAPASMASGWQQLLSYTQKLLSDIVKLEAYAKHDDSRSVAALSHSTEATMRQLQVTATQAGFKDCSRLK